jgi:hypothetical protein
MSRRQMRSLRSDQTSPKFLPQWVTTLLWNESGKALLCPGDFLSSPRWLGGRDSQQPFISLANLDEFVVQ